jgi:hypothetical protein
MNAAQKTLLWRSAVTVTVILMILGAFYTDQNARGLHGWRKVEQEITVRGGSLNWNDYIPRMPPSGSNFFDAPMMTEWFMRANTTSVPTSVPLSQLLANPENTVNPIDGLSASNYLAWSAAFDPQFNQIREALKRPAARLVGDYTKPFSEPVPNFVTYRIIGQVLAHRAKCHLLLGAPDQALDDLTLLHDINFTLVRDGKPMMLVAPMVHVAIAGLYANAVDAGLDAHAWREPDLAALEKQLSEIQLPPLLADAFQTERAGACRLIDHSVADLMGGSARAGTGSNLGWWFVPKGWLDQNKVLVAELEEQMIECIDLTNHVISPSKSRATQLTSEDAFRYARPWNFIAAMCTPNFSRAGETVARNQTWVDHARIVCALERYRLRNGQYPPTLAPLVPQFIDAFPNDIVSGKAIIYQPKGGQDFKLYSVGWNELDEGGVIARKGDGSEDMDSGDWVWHYPEP